MKRLFNEYEAYNTRGYSLDNEVHRLIKPVIRRWIEDGFSINDIEHIFMDNVAIICAERKLLKATKMFEEKWARTKILI